MHIKQGAAVQIEFITHTDNDSDTAACYSRTHVDFISMTPYTDCMLIHIPMEQCLTRLTLAPFHNFFVIEKRKKI
ncbi:hypothetical protein CUMW_261650 [Citrus unshiu]|uniref:Uncharacterized protein n=2 Tax=Citrus TaxID=2706 RepID=A0A2H5QU50_CITUN|nr:hypothetical protein CUMW_261650 [Citrus unshiu]